MSGPYTLPPIVDELVGRLAPIEGVVAVALGGSYARGTQRPDSDIDLGLYYREESPFSIEDIRRLADELNDAPSPVVTDFGRWGRWVNGGAWLTNRGQRIDWLYRSLDDLERVIETSRRGEIEWDFPQQPPYGFHSHTYLGELHICRPLYDPTDVLTQLKAKLEPYPQALKRSIISRRLWGAEFDLSQGKRFAEQGDIYGAAGCFTRCAAQLVQVVYALNERYFVSDKGALEEIESFAIAPPDFGLTLRDVLARPGGTSAELVESARQLEALLRDVIELCAGLYERPEFGG